MYNSGRYTESTLSLQKDTQLDVQVELKTRRLDKLTREEEVRISDILAKI